jgi:hypothetical protein
MTGQDDEPVRELRRAISTLSGARYHREVVGGADGVYGQATVFRVRPGHVLHIVGGSALADRLRELLAAGAGGHWSLHAIPRGHKPLAVLAEPLQAYSGHRRYCNLLDKAGFATAQEVDATPDTALL